MHHSKKKSVTLSLSKGLGRFLVVALQTFVFFVSASCPSCLAGNIYPWRIIAGATTGEVDELRFTDPSDITLTLTNLPGGGRRANVDIIGGGGSSGSNTIVAGGFGLQATQNGNTNTLSINPSVVVTAGAPASVLIGGVTASITNPLVAQASLPAITNSLADKALVTSTSNTLAAAINSNAGASNTILLAGTGIQLIDNGGNTNTITVDPSVVVTAGAPASVLSGGVTADITNSLVAQASLPAITNSLADKTLVGSASNTLAQATARFPTNGVSTTTTLGAIFSNGVLTTASSVVPLTNAASTASALVSESISAGVLTITPNPNILTNSDTQALTYLGTVTISNNATVTGTLFVGGALSASSIVGAVTSAVASINGLVSNVTIAATGNAAVTATAVSNGGTITVNVPVEFAITNTSTAAPLWWSTKYGAMRVSNSWGSTFINTPDLAALSNEDATLTEYFTSATTGAWINVNVSGAWTVMNTNNHLLISSSGEANGNGNYIVKAIPVTNQSWRARILIDNISDNSGTIAFNADIAVSALEDTNAPTHSFVLHRNSSNTPALRGISSTSPASTWNPGAETAADPNIPLVNNYCMQSTWLWLQVGYDGISNLTYSAAYGQVGLPPFLKTLKTKNSQTVRPRYVGLGFNDAGNTGPQFLIKEFVFEQP